MFLVIAERYKYLGYCEQKGSVYSVRVKPNKYSIIAHRNGNSTTLITFEVGEDRYRR